MCVPDPIVSPPPLLQAYELSTLTGTQVLLLVASETGHVYTFATRKLQPMITSETGKALIQTCLNSPDSPPRSDPTTDQRMSATGFEETDLTYQVSESDSSGETKVKKTGDLAPRGCLLFGVFSSSGPAGWRQGAWPLVSELPTGPARPPGRLSALLSLPGRLHALALIDKNLILPPWPYKAWFPSPESLAGPLTFLISCSCLLLWCCFGRGQGEDVGNGNIWPDRAFLRPARRPYRRRPPRVPLLEGACPGSRKKVPGMGQPLRPQLLGVRV